MADSFVESIKQFAGFGSTQEESVGGSVFSNGRSAGILDSFFGSDVFGEEEMTPHARMHRVREMIDRNAFLADGLSTYSSLFISGEVRIESDDARTEEEMNEWLDNSGLVKAMSNGGVGDHYKGIGNSYYHVKRGRATGIVKEFELITRPEDMWIRLDDSGQVRDYILEVPNELRSSTDYEDENFSNFVVYYGEKGLQKNTVTGIRFEPDEILHVPQSLGVVLPYGRSDLASASSDEKILREIERSYGIMARHKQVPKILWTLKDRLNDGPLDAETFEEVKDQLNNVQDKDNPIVNGNVQAEMQDYSYGGAEINMQETIDYLKRKVTSPVGPQFLMHGDMTTNAVSNDQLAVFFQEVRGDRKQHKEKLLPIIRDVRDQKGLSGSVSLKFGDLSLTTDRQERENALNMWDKGAITLNEVRDRIGMPEDEEFDEDPYKWEVQSQPSAPAQQVQQTLRQAVEDE